MFRVKQPRSALKYLVAALEFEKDLETTQAHELAATYLNLSAVYSELGQHLKSAEQALKSIILIREFINSVGVGQVIHIVHSDKNIASNLIPIT